MKRNKERREKGGEKNTKQKKEGMTGEKEKKYRRKTSQRVFFCKAGRIASIARVGGGVEKGEEKRVTS